MATDGGHVADEKPTEAGEVRLEPLRRYLARWCRANRGVCWIIAAALTVLAGLILKLSFYPGEQAKGSANWNLLYEEHFDGPLDDRWVGSTSSWDSSNAKPDLVRADDPNYFSRVRGAITSRARVDGYLDLVYQRHLIGDFRVEWEYTPLAHTTNLNCFIDGDSRNSGYTIHVGGFGDPRRCVLTKGHDYEKLDDNDELGVLTVGRRYHFLMQKEGHTISFAVDGLHIFDYVDADILDLPNIGSFGFDSVGESPVRIEDVRIYRKPLDQKMSPIDFGDKLVQMGQYDNAFVQFSEIFESFGGTELAPEALYRMALCSLRMKNQRARGLALLDRFQREFPEHPLLVYCLYDRFALARAGGDTATVDRLLGEFKKYRGHPILKKALLDLANQEAQSFQEFPTLQLEDEVYPPDEIARVMASFHKLKDWSVDFGIPLMRTKLQEQFPPILNWFGRADLAEELCTKDSSALAGALFEQGKFEELLQRFPWMVESRGMALIYTGHAKQVVNSREYSEGTRWFAACVLGQAEELLPTFSVRQRIDVLWRLGRSAEALPFAESFPRLMVGLLLDLKRGDEALTYLDTEWVRLQIMYDQGKYDELLSTKNNRPLAYRSAFAVIRQGEPEWGRALLERLRGPSVSYGDEEAIFGRFYLPMLLDNANGATVDRRACLKDLLEHARYSGMQLPWYRAALITGQIDEAAFAKQPIKIYAECRLLIARGIRHELDHEWAQAAHDYRECLALPWYRSNIGSLTKDYLTWRSERLEKDAAR